MALRSHRCYYDLISLASHNSLLTMDLGNRIWQIFTHTHDTHTHTNTHTHNKKKTAPQNPAHPHEQGWIRITTDLNRVECIITVAWFLLLRTTSFWPKTAASGKGLHFWNRNLPWKALPLEVLEPPPTAHLRLEDTDQYLTCYVKRKAHV